MKEDASGFRNCRLFRDVEYHFRQNCHVISRTKETDEKKKEEVQTDAYRSSLIRKSDKTRARIRRVDG